MEDQEKSTPEKTLSRREFLRASLATGIPLSAMLANAYYLLDADYNFFPRQKERHLTETSEGFKVGVILGHHGFMDSKTGEIDASSAIRIETKDLFFPVGALFNDGWTNSLDPRTTGQIVAESIGKAIRLIPNFYKAPFEYALANNVPFVFGDINLKGVSPDQFSEISDLSWKAMLAALTTMLAKGGELALDYYTDFLKGKMTRREFLKLVVTGGIVGTTYLSSPAFTHVARQLGIKPESTGMRDFQAVFSDFIHPDKYAVVMRNIVWALKCRDLFETGTIPKGKIINVPGGLNHKFLDFSLRHPEVVTEYWKVFNYKEIAGSFSQGDTDWVHKSRVYYPSAGKTEIINHESMRTLVA